MKVPYAARFTTLIFLIASSYTWLQMLPGLSFMGLLSERQHWLSQNMSQWTFGWWLWLFAIFSWMLLLIVLGWSYLPAHRVATMLQSGLMLIGAVLAIAGVTVWMAVLPVALQRGDSAENLVPLVDMLAMSLVSAGCFMGGIITAWVAWDLIRQKVLQKLWLWSLALAGLCIAPTPFLGFQRYLLAAALCFWLICTLWLSSQRRMPSPFPEWT